MSALPLMGPKRRLGFGRNVISPKAARRALNQALERHEGRAARSGVEVADVQLLGQVTSAAEWPKLLAYWERRNPSGMGAWPRQLAPGSHALNLWPLPAGRLGHATGLGADVRKRQPKKMLLYAGPDGLRPRRAGERCGDRPGCHVYDLA